MPFFSILELLAVLTTHPLYLCVCCTYSPDGSRVASGSDGASVGLADGPEHTLEGHSGPVTVRRWYNRRHRCLVPGSTVECSREHGRVFPQTHVRIPAIKIDPGNTQFCSRELMFAFPGPNLIPGTLLFAPGNSCSYSRDSCRHRAPASH